jgi:microsomal dipeptidase-like Zn-dependent dipeptidase
MNKYFNIDFHCHPLFRSTSTSCDLSQVNLWDSCDNYVGTTSAERWVSMQLSDIGRSSQAHLKGYCSANTKIIFDALYPVEKGWTNFKALPSVLLGKTMKETIFRISSGITSERFQLLEQRTSYFEELQELNSVLSKHQGQSPDGNYTMKVASNIEAVNDFANNHSVVVIPTIEGAHSLGAGDPQTKGLSLSKHKKLLTDNIHAVKLWNAPPFFIGLAHHFWNQLCGHAKSFKHPVNLVINQQVGLNLGITELGWHVIKELLTRNNGKRILIDVKHMSAKARREYYQFINNNNYLNEGDKIPIICSHTGVNGFDSYKRMMQLADSKKMTNRKIFNNWSMNLCGEEIRTIHQSGGIIGIILDKSILSSSLFLKEISNAEHIDRKNMYLRLIWENIFFMIEAVGNKEAWNTPVFSSDFDGLISQIEFYPSSEYIEMLKYDLTQYLLKYNFKRDLWFNKSPEELVYHVFNKNVMSFLNKHYL